MSSIPAKKYVSIAPGVLGTGGNPLSLNALWATQSIRVPIGQILKFAGLAAVQNFFGVSSVEAALAAIYFSGFTNATKLPGALYFGQYATAPVAGYLRSGTFAGVTLQQLQAFSGALTLSIDGVATTTANINLATCTSFTNAAALIQAGILAGTPSSTATCTYDAVLQAFVITSSTTGANSAVTVATGSLSANLKFTAATGAIVSAGSVASTPAGFLNNAVNQTLNWASFTTTWDPDAGAAGGPIKQAFAAWFNTNSPAGQERFVYAAEDTDIAAASATPDANSFAALVSAFNGVVPIWSGLDPQANPPLSTLPQNIYGAQAAFFCGTVASIDWSRKGGRITFDFKSNAALVPNVVTEQTSDTLDGNGYNYYGGVATANQSFQFFQSGKITGVWKWADDYVAQIYLNSQFQVGLLNFLTNTTAVPYADPGYAGVRGSMKPAINEGTNNGTIVKGVTLSASQIQQVNAAAGLAIDGVLFQQGWYLQVLDPGAQARGNRASPNMTFWYTDGGAIQQINLASIDIQ